MVKTFFLAVCLLGLSVTVRAQCTLDISIFNTKTNETVKVVKISQFLNYEIQAKGGGCNCEVTRYKAVLTRNGVTVSSIDANGEKLAQGILTKIQAGDKLSIVVSEAVCGDTKGTLRTRIVHVAIEK